MNIKDIEIFLVLASTENMQQAAIQCEKSPSVLSKSLRRLEGQLDLQLFDRVGKGIKLNAAGQKLRGNATKMVAQAKQTLAECSGLHFDNRYRVAAPSILLFRWASVLSRTLKSYGPNSSIYFQTYYEQQALEQLVRGTVDIAVVTSAIANQIPSDLCAVKLGDLQMNIAAARNHPIVSSCMKQDSVGEPSISKKKHQVTAAELLAYEFISPNVSPFCGEERGVGCDGWHNDMFPRKLSLIANDYGVLGQLVKSGQALAYLPDYWIRELGLIELDITDYADVEKEEIILVSYQSNLVQLFSAQE